MRKLLIPALVIPIISLVVSFVLIGYAGDRDSSDYVSLQVLSIATILFTLCLFFGIKLLGYLARKHRALLLAFLPAMLVTQIGTACLILLGAGMVIFDLYALMTSFLSRIPTGLIFAIGLAALLGVFQMLAAIIRSFKRPETTVIGQEILLGEHPALADRIAQLCAIVGTRGPDHVVVGLNPTFFVTESRVRCLDGVLKGRTLFVSLPLTRLLTTNEFSAVVAHELAHFSGKDTIYSKRFFPVYKGASESVASLFAQSRSGGASAIAVLPPALVMLFFLHSFSVAENSVSRDREIRADSIAGNAVGKSEISSALIKVHAFAPCWQTIKAHMEALLEEGKQVINASSLFAVFANDTRSEVDFIKLTGTKLSHPTDSHPPLSARLHALEYLEPGETSLDCPAVESMSALSLFSGATEIEENLTDFETALLSKGAA